MLFSRFSPLYEDEPSAGGGGNTQPPSAPISFDADAFKASLKTELLGEIRKDINGIDKKFNKQFETFNSGFTSFKTELQGWLKPAESVVSDTSITPNPPVPDPAKPATAQPEPTKGHQPTPAELALKRQLEALQSKQAELEEREKKALANAETKEVNAALKSEIAKHQFSFDRAPSDLFSLLRPSLTRGEDGNLYGPDGRSLEEYVREEVASRPTWLPPKQANGSGATPASPAGAARGFDIEAIKPGKMTKEDKAAAWQAILQHL